MNQRGCSRSVSSGAAVLSVCVALAAVTAFAAGPSGRAQRQVPGKVGTKAPAFTATLLTGETVDSRSLLGKVVVLKFWYVACGPCRQEIPQLNQMVDEFKDQPVVFLGLALDGPEKLRAFLEEMPYRYQVVPNAQPIIDAFGGTTYYPTHVVIDTRGVVVHFASGGGLQTQDVLRPIIRAALSTSTRKYGHDRHSPHVAGCARSALGPEGTYTSPYLCIEGLRGAAGEPVRRVEDGRIEGSDR